MKEGGNAIMSQTKTESAREQGQTSSSQHVTMHPDGQKSVRIARLTMYRRVYEKVGRGQSTLNHIGEPRGRNRIRVPQPRCSLLKAEAPPRHDAV